MMTLTSEPRTVVDTNVLISAVISSQGKPHRVVKYILTRGALLVSRSTFEEIRSRLQLPRFKKYVDPDQVNDFLNFLQGTAQFFVPTVTVTDCRDPDDNKFLELAVSAHADAIVSGDGDLLTLHPFRGIPILTPAQFLAAVPH